jgi:hypothetical protein
VASPLTLLDEAGLLEDRDEVDRPDHRQPDQAAVGRRT